MKPMRFLKKTCWFSLLKVSMSRVKKSLFPHFFIIDNQHIIKMNFQELPFFY